jgi:Disulphide bond corrector protein DsbC
VHGFHINSNTPHSEFLIPTALKLDAPTDIVVGRVVYPEGRDVSFPFSPDEKLNVYSGDFKVALAVRPLHTVVPGKYAVHGNLKYQACDNAQCYPPKQLPVNFEVKVIKGTEGSGRRNPAQSPHAHR